MENKYDGVKTPPEFRKEDKVETPVAPAPVGFEVVVTVDRLNVRVRPEVSAAVLGVVTRGTRLEVSEETQEWYHVKSVYGEGYVMKKFTEVI